MHVKSIQTGMCSVITYAILSYADFVFLKKETFPFPEEKESKVFDTMKGLPFHLFQDY